MIESPRPGERKVCLMPELPEVEARKRYLEKTSLARTVERVSVTDRRILEDTTPSALGRALRGARFESADRRAKYLLVRTDHESTLLIHFGMTGDLFFRQRGESKPKFSRVEFHFEEGSCLHFTDLRLFGKLAIYDTTDWALIGDIAKLGPEPLGRGFTFRAFRDIVKGHRTTIHQLLMDQGLIAGIGNLYSDEITYQAGVRPDRGASSLSDAEIRRLYDMTKWVLRRAVELDAELDEQADIFLLPNRGRNGQCPVTHDKLVKKTIGGRSSYYCPACQK